MYNCDSRHAAPLVIACLRMQYVDCLLSCIPVMPGARKSGKLGFVCKPDGGYSW